MKIGVLGGTFNPIHKGHLLLGEVAYSNFGLDEIWFLPNGDPPHKSLDENDYIYLQHRIEMVRLSIEDIPYFKLNLHEAKVQEKSYTYETMRAFRECHPDHKFYFILGADSLFEFEKWKRFEEIFPNCIILAAIRDGKGLDKVVSQANYLAEKYDAKIKTLKAPLQEVSSTEIRARIKDKLPIGSMVHEGVIKYIEDNSLYLG